MWVPSVRIRLDSGGHWNSLCSPRRTLTTTPRQNVLTLQPYNKGLKELGARGKISCLLPLQPHLLVFSPLLPPCTLPPCCPWSPGACPCSLRCSAAPLALFTHTGLAQPSPHPCSRRSAPTPQLRLHPHCPQHSWPVFRCSVFFSSLYHLLPCNMQCSLLIILLLLNSPFHLNVSSMRAGEGVLHFAH